MKRLKHPLSIAVLGTLLVAGIASPPAWAVDYPGTVKGRVTNAAGTGLAGVCVEIAPRGPGGLGPDYWLVTDTNGNYQQNSIQPGPYEVNFIPWGGAPITPTERCPGTSGNYTSQCYNAKHHPACDIIDVAGLNTTEANATLAVGGQITGRVTNRRGAGLAGICAGVGAPPNGVLYADASPPLAVTDATGRYTISNLSTGSYRVAFVIQQPCTILPSEGVRDYPGTVSVTEGATTSGIDYVFGDLGPVFAGLRIVTKKLAVSKGGTVRAPLSCPSGAGRCAGKLTLKTAGPVSAAASAGRHKRRRTLKLGAARFSIAAHHTKKVMIKLTRPARRLLARKHNLRAREVVVAHDSSGASKKTTAGVRLEAR